jgi:aminopeptidase YwaD
MTFDPDILGRLAADRALWSDFAALCDCGGRLAGTASERRALALLKERGENATGRKATVLAVRYGGWRATECRLELATEPAVPIPCHPLVRTRATEGALEAEIIDLGRGTPEEFAAHRDELRGRIALVRHEYMFAAGHLHRRRKYDAAREGGAVGFLIAAPLPGGALVAGSSGREGGDGIPAAGIGLESAARLAPDRDGRKRVRLRISTVEAPAETETLLFDVPGRTRGTVVLSAHLDGHDLAESAMDNASGAAVALAVARALAPMVGRFRRGLRLAFFSVEEWALTGSRRYVEALSAAERAEIALNVNLDSVGGSPRLAALTSGFRGLDGFLRGIAGGLGRELRLYRPLMTNSDHANFAAAGIPALRLVAGFDETSSNLRHVLTPADTRDKVDPAELHAAAILTASIVAAACDAPDDLVEAFGTG